MKFLHQQTKQGMWEEKKKRKKEEEKKSFAFDCLV